MTPPIAASPVSLAGRPGWARSLAPSALRILAMLAAAALAGWIGYEATFERALGEIRGSAGHRLDLYAASIEREIEKFAAFPIVVSYDRSIIELAMAPTESERRATADRYLERLNASIGTLAVYILDTTGRCIASSNWNQYDSFVGRDLSYRPYYRNAGIGHIERFYGIGTTNREPGYFLSTALHVGDAVVGTGVVKVGLQQLERSWSSAEAPALLADEHGVVVLSSIPAWKYGTLRPLDPAVRAEIAQAQQYNDRELNPIGMTVRQRLDTDSSIVELSGMGDASQPTPIPGLYLTETRPMPGTPWQLTVFSDLRGAVDQAESAAALAALATLFVSGGALAALQRNRHIKELTRARAALQLAHDSLERTVAERTSALVVANARLQEEVEERSRAERTLREAQSGLVQAGKLAVIGQLSAGMAHELNQPLAALATISGNTIKYLERGDAAAARSNLDRIRPLVERMARLTGELKSFARKSSGEMQAVSIRRTIDNALFLLDHRIKRQSVTLVDEIDGGVTAWCDPNRLEQVMLNLIGNALDATEGQAERRLTLRTGLCGEEVSVEIRDNGPGLPADLLAHLFEPFFTTKAPGAGLGLGLAISAGIVRDFGGDLTATNASDSGASFVMRLPRAKEAAA
ncbi:MAG: ATP-binding protein [Ancalomicrobiaceae bacterium]|nr:ATP-binding protein [Ancalomicrobiaceae bacterium]